MTRSLISDSTHGAKQMAKREGYVEYSSNNSGGHWWLTDDDWLALEKAGWEVKWVKDDEYHQKYDTGDRFLGALATRAVKQNCNSLREAADEWERVTGKSATDAGCACCRQPHNFTFYDKDDNWVDSGPRAEYTASW
jgi:hypothetical protein